MANQISFSGAFSASTLTVPGVFLNIQPVGGVIQPATFNRVGVLGVASWGPKNTPTLIGTSSQLALFGQPVVRLNDLTTAAAVVLDLQQYAGTGANMMLVRVTDGTDAAASGLVGGTGALTFTSLYTGTGGNSISVTLAAGSNSHSGAVTYQITVQKAGFPPEVYDNLGLGLTANALWLALAAAVNNGSSLIRGQSQIVVCSAGNSTSAPTLNSATLTGGTDGTGTITSSVLVGSDTAGARTGLYAFRNAGCSDLVMADFFDATQESTLQTFATSEGVLVHTSGPAGETPTQAQTSKQTQGTDSPFVKRYLGDWITWNDNVNGGQRLLAPATFGAALMSTMQPQQSGLNKQIPNVVSTQRSRTGAQYGNDELGVLVGAGIEVIGNPIPRGSMFGMNTGRTTTSDGSRKTDNWPRLTSFIARSLVGPGSLGTLIGEEITEDFFVTGYDLLHVFLSGMKTNGTIQAFQITLDRTNNPQSQTATGLVVAQIKITYFGIASIFLVNMQTGATVVISSNDSAARLAAGVS